MRLQKRLLLFFKQLDQEITYSLVENLEEVTNRSGVINGREIKHFESVCLMKYHFREIDLALSSGGILEN